ncbi:site-specific integrase [Neobacillus piezotolerans]|uniref:site-specific integrase n=1 Tax=Neobacillus piezotolerans TaxID=2259171 RepID=UPI001CA396AF|nr:site-specific integrase [Neobacillus piezotolerans]
MFHYANGKVFLFNKKQCHLNELSTEVLELQNEARVYLQNSKSENTKKAYSSDWMHFEAWCEDRSFSSLPATPETMVYYITFLGKTKKASTIKRKMAAVSQRHETAGFLSPTKTPLVRGVWEGLQRKIGIYEKGKDALWLHELRQLIEALP